MSEVVLIYGKSGSGKSRSLLNFGEDEIFLINVCGKRLPIRKKFKYVMVSDDVNTIAGQISKMPTKIAVIDDAGYLMTNKFMREHSGSKKGAGQFDLYNDIADDFWRLIRFCKSLPDDVIVYITMHEDTSDYGETKLRTIGKLLNDKVCIEGMCTIVLRSIVDNGEYYFLTQSSGSDISKSPEGMLEQKMPNDLKLVDTAIREYWGITKEDTND